MKKIIVAHGDIAKIASEQHVTPRSVSNALNYRHESAKAERIRKVACSSRYGGNLVEW